MDLDTEVDADDTVFLTADVAADALLFSLFPLNSFNNLDPAVFDALAFGLDIGAEQAWSAGKRCEGQNWAWHCCNQSFNISTRSEIGRDLLYN